MALSATALTTLAKLKRFLGLGEESPSAQLDALTIYHDKSGGVTAATVQVTDTALVLVRTPGGTSTLTFADADKDTLGELVTAINALALGWVATLQGDPAASSTWLVTRLASSAWGEDQELTLKYTGNDEFERLIESASDQVESWLDRRILSQDYSSELYPFSPCSGLLRLHQPDVTAVGFVSLEVDDGLTVKYAGADTLAVVEVRSDRLVLRSRSGAAWTETPFTFAAQPTLAGMATAIAGVAGWTATLRTAGPSAHLDLHPAEDAKSREITLEAWQPYDDIYVLHAAEGYLEIKGWPGVTFGSRSGVARIRVDYTAGFATVPFEVEQVVLEVARHLYLRQKVNTNLQSERLGDYSYVLGGGNGIGVEQAPRADWMDRLTRYSRYVSAC